MGELGRLAERIEAGEDVGAALGPIFPNEPATISINTNDISEWLSVRAATRSELDSLDAALELAKRVLPGWSVNLTIANRSVVTLSEPYPGARRAEGAHKEPARAIVAAVLRAVERRGEG